MSNHPAALGRAGGATFRRSPIEWAALVVVLVVAAFPRLWRTPEDVFGTEYYSAGVRSMLGSWHAFFFNAFDPAGFVSLDKPPLAFWFQAASAGLFGFSPFALALPQLIEGLASVALLYVIVRRSFGATDGLLAALFLAVTPVAVAVDRSTNTDSCLVLLLVLAAGALLRAVETGRTGWIVASAAMLGLAFNAKMLVAFVVAPVFFGLYLASGPGRPARRIAQLVGAGGVMLVLALAWAAIYDLTPRGERPYAGSSRGDSMLELVVVHNGLERFVSPRGPAPPAGRQPRRAPFSLNDDVPVGVGRLADRHLAGQFGWLLPLAALALIAAALSARRAGGAWWRGGAAIQFATWTGWGLSFWLVYSLAGGIFHAYYLATLAPPVAALAAMGVVAAWRLRGKSMLEAALLPAALAATGAWQAWINWPYLVPPMRDPVGWTWVFLVAAALGGVALCVLAASRRRARLGLVAAGIGVTALLVAPVAWSLSLSIRPGSAVLPNADLSRLTGLGGDPRAIHRRARVEPAIDARLFAYIRANRAAERFALATPNARLAAPVIVRSGEPVMAIGGYNGSDPILILGQFAARVAAGEVRFILVGGFADFGFGPSGETRRRAWMEWIGRHGKPVDPGLWRRDDASAATRRLVLYDLRTGAPLVDPGGR